MLDNYGSPFMQSPQIIKFRESDTTINDFIAKKIEALQPLLNDNDTTANVLRTDNISTLSDEDDTRILESQSHINRKAMKKQKKFNKDIQQFRNLRKSIRKALKIEKISKVTKKMIITAIDGMLGHILENQCSWKSSGYLLRRHGAPKDGNMFTLSGVWDLLWKRLKPKNRKGNEIFLQHFQDFVTKILRDTEDTSKQYSIVCQLMENTDRNSSINKQNNNLLRENDTSFKSQPEKVITHLERVPLQREIDEQSKPEVKLDLQTVMPLRSNNFVHGVNESCRNFRVCSNELHKFMMDFFNNLKDNIIATFNIYAELFSRDVRADNRYEREIVITQVRLVANKLETQISNVFQEQTNNFALDENKNKDANYKNIKLYIKKCVAHVKKQAMSTLNISINDLRSIIKTNVEKDIAASLDSELDNFEKDLIGKICTTFQVCNGQHLTRRDGMDDQSDILDKNSMFLTLQLFFDDLSKEINRLGQYRKASNGGQWTSTTTVGYGTHKSLKSLQ